MEAVTRVTELIYDFYRLNNPYLDTQYDPWTPNPTPDDGTQSSVLNPGDGFVAANGGPDGSGGEAYTVQSIDGGGNRQGDWTIDIGATAGGVTPIGVTNAAGAVSYVSFSAGTVLAPISSGYGGDLTLGNISAIEVGGPNSILNGAASGLFLMLGSNGTINTGSGPAQ